MKFRPKTPPEAIPFQRGRASPAPTAGVKPFPMKWISPAVWSALAAEGTEAHRLASGSDMWLERFGSDVLLSYQAERGRDAVLAELDPRCGDYPYRPRRVFGKYLPHQASDRGAPILLRGEAGGALETEVDEAGVRYGLDFAAGYSAGLFIDQRANRARVRAWKPKRLLNTFAYTCSFSVVAALAGAETVSVDLSRRSLTRGGEAQRTGPEGKGASLHRRRCPGGPAAIGAAGGEIRRDHPRSAHLLAQPGGRGVPGPARFRPPRDAGAGGGRAGRENPAFGQPLGHAGRRLGTGGPGRLADVGRGRAVQRERAAA